MKEAIGDRIPGAVLWNLFDIDAKFGDVETVERCLQYLDTLGKASLDQAIGRAPRHDAKSRELPSASRPGRAEWVTPHWHARLTLHNTLMIERRRVQAWTASTNFRCLPARSTRSCAAEAVVMTRAAPAATDVTRLAEIEAARYRPAI